MLVFLGMNAKVSQATRVIPVEINQVYLMPFFLYKRRFTESPEKTYIADRINRSMIN
jgi:hypothetical protein